MIDERGRRAAAQAEDARDERAEGKEPGAELGREEPQSAKVPAAPPRQARTHAERAANNPIHADKPVFTLSVAADLLGMHPRTLRIYEEERLVVPYRTDTQRRRYSQNDIRKFQFIQHLTQRLHVNLAGVRIILEMLEELNKHGVDFTQRLYEMADEQEPLSSSDEL